MEVVKEFLSPIEMKAVVYGLKTIQEDAEIGLRDIKNLNIEAKRILQEVYDSSTSALKKLADVLNKGVMFAKIEEYKPGDEDEFIEKPKKG